MSFFRNREIRWLCLILMAATALACAAGFWVSVPAGLGALAAGSAVSLVSLLFTARRYRQIDQLSVYLRRITAGEHALDIRDNDEGELSILKSEIYKVTVMLAEYNERLLAEQRGLSDSLSDISHQLKTPLTSMLVMADLLSGDDLPSDKRREFTGHIRQQLERIQWLVSSLLKMSKMDAGVAVFKKDAVSLPDLIRRVTAPLLIPIEIKEQTLETDGPDISFEGDGGWMNEALVNILKNCIEHTPRGGRLRVEWTSNPLYTEIRISDTGEGIASEDLPHIFTRFYRGKNAADESVGIGLAMAREIVRRQNGDITAENQPGGGALFSIKLYKHII
ncbi:MAG: HAMP domain-containing histidine kinase [Clostridiales bacterium]|nr:HAMP domain-containing histidine kinase [Clostridiales bacterium]